MEAITEEMGYKNVSTIGLKKAVREGFCPILDYDKLKLEDYKDEDRLVKASVKGGAIVYALWHATQTEYPEKRHIIVYTNSDLSTDLWLCGLNFDTIINGNVDCSVSQR